MKVDDQMMFKDKFYLREEKIRRSYSVIDTLLNRLEDYAAIYEANTSDLMNLCVEELIQNEDIQLFKKEKGEVMVTRTFHIRESNVTGLEELKDKYAISIYKLLNIAIKNMLDREDEARQQDRPED